MSYNVPQAMLDMLQSGAIPANIKVVSNDPAGGAGAGGVGDGTWANPYRTIQAAVDSMVAPTEDPTTWFDQIWIMAGTYNETVTITRSKYMAIYTLGPVRIGIPDTPGPGEPKNLVWDKEVSAFQGFLIVLPMPMAASPDFTLLEITGDIIIKGSEDDTRVLWLQNTKAEILQGENPGLETAWNGGLNLMALRSRLTSVRFGNKVNYGWTFRESKVDEGIFVGGSAEFANGNIIFDQTEVDAGAFTPFGYLEQTASVWAPEATGSEILNRSLFDSDVTMEGVSMEDSVFEGGVLVTNTTGAPDFRNCLFNGAANFGDFGYIINCRFNTSLEADAEVKGYILGTVIKGVPITFPNPSRIYIDIATNSMTKAEGFVFPGGTNLLNNTDIP